MTTQIQDDGFHEIQLNGKQLVFLFMAATVVSVVIFLCGVLVGRGVKAERPTSAPADAGTLATPEAPQPSASTPAAAVNGQPVATAPPIAPLEDQLTYPQRLGQGNRKETLQPAPERTVAGPPPPAAPVPRPVAAAPNDAPVSPAVAAADAPRGDGYAIQVAALREPSEADTIARRLVSKGYDAYVLTPPGGMPNVYRVRVGSFKTRRDAEPVAAKLQREELFKPWITR